MHAGVLKGIFEDSGFGFISSDVSPSVFVRIEALSPKFRSGDPVALRNVDTDRGPRATHVEKIDGDKLRGLRR